MNMGKKRKIKFLSAGLVLVLMLSIATTATAHPADMFFQSHTLYLTPQNVQLAWTIVPGSMIAPLLWSDADRDEDGHIGPAETLAWSEPLLAQFTASIDDRSLPWQIDSVKWPTLLEKFQVGDEKIVIHLTATWPPQLFGSAQLILHNQFQESITINWFSIQGENGLTFHVPQQSGGTLQVAIVVPDRAQASPASADNTLLDYWDSGTPSLLITTSCPKLNRLFYRGH